MTLSKNTLQCVEDFLVEFSQKKFNDEEIQTWAMVNLPTFSKDTFYFFKKTLKQFYYPVGNYLIINHEFVQEIWKNNEIFLKKFNDVKKVK